MDALVTISGPPCGGSTTVARLLARLLSRPLIEAGPRYRQQAAALGLPQEETWYIEATRLKEIDREMVELVQADPKVIWEGRLTAWFSQSLNARKVWCSASLATRVHRYATRERVSDDMAHQRIVTRETQDRELFTRLYGAACNFDEPGLYDLAIVTDHEEAQAIANNLCRELLC